MKLRTASTMWPIENFSSTFSQMGMTKERWYVIGGVLVKVIIKLTSARHFIQRPLVGKVVIITGGTAGIGKEVAGELARHGATVHIIADGLMKGVRAVVEMKQKTGNQSIFLHPVDLCDFASIRAFAKEFLATGAPVHLLINNAMLIGPDRVITRDGVDRTMQVNHLSHFLLTNLLLERMIESAPSRIVNMSSHLHYLATNFDVHDLNFEITDYYQMFGFQAYCWSKLANLLFTRELARRLYGKNVTVNAVHPGAVRTEALRNFSFFNPMVLPITVLKPFYKSAFDGAQTCLYGYAATAAELENVSGHYFAECKPATVHLKALDDKLASELWTESEKLTG